MAPAESDTAGVGGHPAAAGIRRAVAAVREEARDCGGERARGGGRV